MIVCPGCGDELSSLNQLGYHVDQKHYIPRTMESWACFCGEKFKQLEQLVAHLRRVGVDNLDIHWVQSRLRGVAS